DAVREARARRRGQRDVEAAAVPGARAERVAPARRHVPRPPDRMNGRRFVCDECTRADLLRATAGRGLPAIEPGMPVPAGTGLTRRGFVARSVGIALSVYGVGRLAAFDEGIANAAAAGPQPILVTVFLQGGADSL